MLSWIYLSCFSSKKSLTKTNFLTKCNKGSICEVRNQMWWKWTSKDRSAVLPSTKMRTICSRQAMTKEYLSALTITSHNQNYWYYSLQCNHDILFFSNEKKSNATFFLFFIKLFSRPTYYQFQYSLNNASTLLQPSHTLAQKLNIISTIAHTYTHMTLLHYITYYFNNQTFTHTYKYKWRKREKREREERERREKEKKEKRRKRKRKRKNINYRDYHSHRVQCVVFADVRVGVCPLVSLCAHRGGTAALRWAPAADTTLATADTNGYSVNTHVHIHTHTHTHPHPHTHVHIHIIIHIHIHVHTHPYPHPYSYSCPLTSIHVHIHTDYLHIHLFTNTHYLFVYHFYIISIHVSINKRIIWRECAS